MYTVYSFNNSGPMGIGKSVAFFKTKEEADRAQKIIVEQAKQNGHDVKVFSRMVAQAAVGETNDLANKIRKLPPSAAIYYFDDLISEIDNLQNQVNELKKKLYEFTKDQ